VDWTQASYSCDDMSRRTKMAEMPSWNSFTQALPQDFSSLSTLSNSYESEWPRTASPIQAPKIIQHSRNSWRWCSLKTLKSANFYWLMVYHARLARGWLTWFVSTFYQLHNLHRTSEECAMTNADLNPGLWPANMWFT
jgi:hypothetical protein